MAVVALDFVGRLLFVERKEALKWDDNDAVSRTVPTQSNSPEGSVGLSCFD